MEILKSLHADKFDESFIDSMLKRRSDFENAINGT